jgi:hypothetical protein
MNKATSCETINRVILIELIALTSRAFADEVVSVIAGETASALVKFGDSVARLPTGVIDVVVLRRHGRVDVLVSWSSLGSVDPQTAVQFATQLGVANQVAALLKDLIG